MKKLLLGLLLLAVSATASAQFVRSGNGWIRGSGGFLTPGTGVPPYQISLTGLQIVGNQLRNGANQTIQLRSVNRDSGEYMCLGSSAGPAFRGPVDQGSVDGMLAWGINSVRIPLNESCWLGINGAPFGGLPYRTAIKAYVDLLIANNIAPLVTLQWSGGLAGRLAGPYPSFDNALLPMPGVDAVEFWTSVASFFNYNSMIVFDLYNEPIPNNNTDNTTAWTCLRDGCTEYTRVEGTAYQATGTQAMVNAIRATGNGNIIMVPGVQFTNSLTQWLAYKPVDPLTVDQLMASWHAYAGQICAGQSCVTTYIAPVAAQVPVIADEIGQNDCQPTYVVPLMQSLDAIGASYGAWAWNDYDCSYPAVIASYDGTPTSYGAHIRAHFQARAGMTVIPPPAITYYKNAVFPYGINVGSSSNFTAADGTVYYADVEEAGLDITESIFTPFTNGSAIAGTTDDVLYQTGKEGVAGNWTINVPNGNYRITLGVATSSAFNTGEFGFDVYQSASSVVAGCRFSMTPVTCPGTGTTPTVNTAYTYTYDVSTLNQQLFIQVGASFGGGRETILNSIKVVALP